MLTLDSHDSQFLESIPHLYSHYFQNQNSFIYELHHSAYTVAQPCLYNTLSFQIPSSDNSTVQQIHSISPLFKRYDVLPDRSSIQISAPTQNMDTHNHKWHITNQRINWSLLPSKFGKFMAFNHSMFWTLVSFYLNNLIFN